MTTHYSAAELANLVAAANKACVKRDSSVLASVASTRLNTNRVAINTTDNPRLAAKKTSLLEVLNRSEVAHLERGRAKVAQAVLQEVNSAV